MAGPSGDEQPYGVAAAAVLEGKLVVRTPNRRHSCSRARARVCIDILFNLI